MDEDNKTLQRVYKKELEQQRADEKAYDKAYANKLARESTSDGQSFMFLGNGFSAISLILFLIGIVIFLLALFFLIPEGRQSGGYVAPGDNCTLITCPAGADGPSGAQGNPGPIGNDGPQGAQGAQGEIGPQGNQGPKGDRGLCDNNNPMCMQGGQGDTGPQGAQGRQGIGLIGPQGVQGDAGPAGLKGDTGITGAQGEQGPQGDVGATGPQGAVPDPLMLTQLDVDTINLDVTLDCSGGGQINANCFAPIVCPILNMCNLQAQQLLLDFPLGSTLLQVGQTDGIAGTMGNPRVIFGDMSTVPADDYILDEFRVYGQQVAIDARNGYSTVVGPLGDYTVNLLGLGPYTINTANGAQQYLSGQGWSVTVTGAGNIFMGTTAGDFIVDVPNTQTTTAGTMNHRSNNYNLVDNSLNLWMRTISSGIDSLACNGSIPHANAELGFEYPYIEIGRTMILNQDVDILTRNPNGLINISGLNLCNGQISSNVEIEVNAQNTTIYGTLSVEGTLSAALCAGCVSDGSVKNLLGTLDPNESLAIINKMNPVHYRFKPEFLQSFSSVPDKLRIGFVAQELKELIPEVVRQEPKKIGDKIVQDFHTVEMANISPRVVSAIQALHKKIQELENKINEMALKI